MREIYCNDCYYGGICCSDEQCEHFCPMTDDAELIYIESLIEQGRAEYYKEWLEYIDDAD